MDRKPTMQTSRAGCPGGPGGRPTGLAGLLSAKALPMLLAAILCLPLQAAFPEPAFAAVTGTASPSISIFYGTGEKVSGEWKEDILTIDGEPAYCVEVDSSFESGAEARPCDPVATGIWSQEICTKLALIDAFVKSGAFVSTKKGTGDGHRVTRSHEQYAVAQCYIWKFLNDYGYSQNHYGWFGAATEEGVDLTGSDTDAQVWDHVRANMDSFEGSAVYYDCGNSQDLACSFSLNPKNGRISLSKRSSDEELSGSSSAYSLAGAEYGVFGDESCQQESQVATLLTNDQGEACSPALPAGSYYVKEAKASPGFTMDPSTYKVEVLAGEDSVVNPDAGFVFEQPASGGVSLQKKSARPGLSEGNGCYSLEGALYGIYADSACKQLIAKSETDAEGRFQADGLPLGPCYVREISAPAGFATDGTVYETVVEEGKTTPVNGGRVEDLPKCAIPEIAAKKHDAQIGPESSGTQTGKGLENAEFRVSFYGGAFENAQDAAASGKALRTWVFKSDAEGRVPFDEEHLVSGDALYLSAEGKPCLPLGTIVVEEAAPPSGYLPSDEVHCIRISDDGSAGETVANFQPAAFGNQVKRGDLEFTKVSGSNDNALAGIPFAVTNQATGEKHVLVTDGKGRASTASDAVPHSRDTNGNDRMLDSEGGGSPAPDDGEKPDDGKEPDQGGSEGGKEPGGEGSGNGQEPPSAQDPDPDKQPGSDVPPVTAPPVDDDDSTDTQDVPGFIETAAALAMAQDGKALPGDTGAAQPSAAEGQGSEGKEDPESGKEPESGNGQEGPGEDGDGGGSRAKPTGIWFGYAGEGADPIAPDEKLGALPCGTYLVEELPCAENEGLQLVTASVVIGEHGQTVDLGFVDDPEATISTSASDAADGDKTLAASDAACVVDRVAYANLIPGRPYKLSGKLVDTETGKQAADSQGNGISAEAEFTPESESGTAEVRFEFPAEGMEGASLTAFETLSCDGRVLALHEDPKDPDQTVGIAAPAIGTQARGAGSGQTAVIGTGTVVTDTVSYTSLVPGREHALKGRLVDAATGETLATESGEAVASCTFTPEAPSGSVDLEFGIDATGFEEGTRLVVFQQLFDRDRLVASHEDANAPGQTIELVKPSVQTSLAETGTGRQAVSAGAPVSLTDRVSYSNLSPGREYVLEGRLVDKGTGETALDQHGDPIEAKHAFTPEEPQGTAQVEFAFEGANLNGSTLVAFETLTLDGAPVAEHADVESRAQSVTVAMPQIQTYASDPADQDQVVEAGGPVKLRDTVSVTGATPGRSYTVVGVLMDKATGLPLMQKAPDDDGKEAGTAGASERLWEELIRAAGLRTADGGQGQSLAIDGTADPDALRKLAKEHPEAAGSIAMATQQVQPDSPSFTVDMDFGFDAQGISGQTVVFEGLYDNEAGRFAAVHSDLQDKNQTVEVREPKKEYPPSESKAPNGLAGKAYDKTGNLIARYLWAIALLAALGCAFGAASLSRRKSLRKRKGLRL